MTNTIKWDKPCYKCLSHLCDLSCKETSKTEEQDDEVLGFNGWGFPIEKPNKAMTTQTEALKALVHEMEYVLSCINEDKVPFDGDDFHEALRLGKEALSQTENDKERCVGCEACIDTACGRDECPKGWPKAAQPEQEEKLPPVEIGVDVTKEGTAVTAFYRRPNSVMEMFYSQFHPAPQRTWVGLTDEEVDEWTPEIHVVIRNIEAKLKEKNT